MTLGNRSGQSTLEYVVILIVVVGAMVAVGILFGSDLAATYHLVYPK